MRLAFSFLVICLQLNGGLYGQSLDKFMIIDTIEIRNGSFEEGPGESPAIVGSWFDCGDPGETAPSVFVNGSPLLMKEEVAQNGNVFLNLVTRGNSTWEAIAQPLSKPLKAESNYVIKLYLRRSAPMDKETVATEKASKIGPIVLSIHSIKEIRNQATDRNNIIEKLATSDLIVEEEWTEHTFVFKPRKEVTILMFEAFYEVPVLLPYHGHLFLDNISHLFQVD